MQMDSRGGLHYKCRRLQHWLVGSLTERTLSALIKVSEQQSALAIMLAEEPIRYSFHAFFTKRMIPVENAIVLTPKTTDSVCVSSQVRLMPTSHHNHRLPVFNKTQKSNIAPTWSSKRNWKLAPNRTDEFHNGKAVIQTHIERSRGE